MENSKQIVSVHVRNIVNKHTHTQSLQMNNLAIFDIIYFYGYWLTSKWMANISHWNWQKITKTKTKITQTTTTFDKLHSLRYIHLKRSIHCHYKSILLCIFYVYWILCVQYMCNQCPKNYNNICSCPCNTKFMHSNSPESSTIYI